MRRTLTAIVILLAIVACRKEAAAGKGGATATATSVQDMSKANIDVKIAPEPVVLDKFQLGGRVDESGNVAEAQAAFKEGEAVYLTMWLKESPAGLRTAARWYKGSEEKEFKEEQKPMNGGKVVTFQLATKGLEPGKYKVEGYWGGNVACEVAFEISGAAKAAPAKKK